MDHLFSNNEHVKIDQAHADLLYGLIVSLKPKKVLELGVGGGKSADTIISAIKYNNNNCDFTLVDNWYDFGFSAPIEIINRYKDDADIITSNEKDFVFSCREKFDLIFSDADHNCTDQWFEFVYNNLLNDNGILIYHDVNLFEDVFINLRSILNACEKLKLNYYLFNKNSLLTERCHRGMLVIFKNK